MFWAISGVILAVIPIIWGLYSYINIKKKEADSFQFTTYHDLIRQLVEPEKPDLPLFLDRQIAIIFEFRFYRKYYPLSLRILKGLRESWGKNGINQRMSQELDLPINFLEKKVHDRPNRISN